MNLLISTVLVVLIMFFDYKLTQMEQFRKELNICQK